MHQLLWEPLPLYLYHKRGKCKCIVFVCSIEPNVLSKKHHKQKEKMCHFLPERFNSPTLTKLPVCCEVHGFIFSCNAMKQ